MSPEATPPVAWRGLGARRSWDAARRREAVISADPVLPRLLGEQEQAALGAAVARMGGLAAEGRLAEAAHAFAGFPFTEDDLAVAKDAGYFEAAGI